MKASFFLSVVFFLLCGNTFGQQCPKPGLIIQSAACDSPRNLRADAITCKELNVKWQGRQNQTYIVKATLLDPTTSKLFETETSKYSCDRVSNCQATLPVQEGNKVNWSVQAICTEQGAVLYSATVEGGEVEIPLCQEVKATKVLRVYPNPTSSILIVEYNGQVTDNTEFAVYEVSGKKVYAILAKSVVKTNTGYQLDLHALINGGYVLRVTNGGEVSEAKFVILKN